MFNNKNQQPATRSVKKVDNVRDTAVTILTSGCHFNGKLYCRGSTRIGGTIEGEIVSEGLLIIEDEAKINANIKAEEAVIQGAVQGKLEAMGRVELCASSSFTGDIVTPVLVIREGAHFNGRASMTEKREGREKHGRKNEVHNGPVPADDIKISMKEVAFEAIPEVAQ